MAVFTNTSTALFSKAWTPKSTASYVGTCIFLAVLAIIWRSLFAAMTALEIRWKEAAWNRRYIMVADKIPMAEQAQQDLDLKTAVLNMNGVEEHVKMVQRHINGVQPWRFNVDLARAALVTVMLGVGYLLMLAVMTFNVGYFLSVLGGIFVGEVAVGRYIQGGGHTESTGGHWGGLGVGF